MELSRSALVAHSAENIFDLIEAGEHYPEFRSPGGPDENAYGCRGDWHLQLIRAQRPRFVRMQEQPRLCAAADDEIVHLGRSPCVLVGLPGLRERFAPQIGRRERQIVIGTTSLAAVSLVLAIFPPNP